MSQTQRIDGSGLQPHKVGTEPRAQLIDSYRREGVLGADRLASAMIDVAEGDPARMVELKQRHAPFLSPVERGRVDRAIEQAEGMSFGEHVVDGGRQFGSALWGTVKGLGSLGWGLVKTSYDMSPVGWAVDGAEALTGTEAPAWLPSGTRGAERIDGAVQGIAAMGKAVWDDPSILIAEYRSLHAEGRYGAIGGQLLADFGDLLIGTKGAGKVGRTANILGDAGRFAKISDVAKAADTAADFARTVRATPGGLDDAAETLRATRATLAEVDTAAMNAGERAQVARALDEIDVTLRGLPAEWRANPIGAAARQTGLPERDIFAILDTPKYDASAPDLRPGRPAPETYLPEGQIAAHLARFDDGAVRFGSRESFTEYGTLGPEGGFVMPARDFAAVVDRAGGDMRKVEEALGLDAGYLGQADTMIVQIDRADMTNLRMPSGNEGGANMNWVPGGYTSGGIPEAVMDFPAGTPYRELSLGD